jgi:aryl-alcohol dehydrogenase
MGSVLSNCSSIVVIDPISNRRELALELGATHVLDPGEDRVIEEILDITEGGADFSIEASGNPAAVKMSIECLARPGWCAQVGATPAQTFHSLDMDHLGFGRGIKGVVMGDAYAKEFVPYLAELHSQGKLPFEKLVKEYKFDDINLAIADSRNGDVIKPILIM